MGAKWLATCKSNGKGTNAASKKHADLIQSSAAALDAFINARFPSILPSESHAILPGGLRSKRFDSISFSEFLLNALHEDGNDYGTSIICWRVYKSKTHRWEEGEDKLQFQFCVPEIGLAVPIVDGLTIVMDPKSLMHGTVALRGLSGITKRGGVPPAVVLDTPDGERTNFTTEGVDYPNDYPNDYPWFDMKEYTRVTRAHKHRGYCVVGMALSRHGRTKDPD